MFQEYFFDTLTTHRFQFGHDLFYSHNNFIYITCKDKQQAQLIAKQLELSLKDTASTLGRYGGEEFGIVLSDCNFEQAWIIAEKCRMEIERLQLQHAFSTFGVVTMSLGVAYICPKPGETSDMLIAKADSALYLAKKNGKNRVERAS